MNICTVWIISRSSFFPGSKIYWHFMDLLLVVEALDLRWAVYHTVSGKNLGSQMWTIHLPYVGIKIFLNPKSLAHLVWFKVWQSSIKFFSMDGILENICGFRCTFRRVLLHVLALLKDVLFWKSIFLLPVLLTKIVPHYLVDCYSSDANHHNFKTWVPFIFFRGAR